MNESEISHEALKSDLRLLYKKLADEPDKEKQAELVIQFAEKIIRLLEQPNFVSESIRNNGLSKPQGQINRRDIEEIINMIVNRIGMRKYLILGSGTAGKRVYFDSRHPEKFSLGTKDNRVGWMYMPEPSGTDTKEYYKKFIETFGERVVQLISDDMVKA